MYRIWQQKHFPLHGFDEALDQIADIAKTNQLKVSCHVHHAHVSVRCGYAYSCPICTLR